jgi:hypothetical protein
MSQFKSKKEFKTVIDRVIAALDEDPEVGPKLRALNTPQQFTFTDMGLTVTIGPGDGRSSNLVWDWKKKTSFEPVTRLQTTSAVANSFMQGKLRVAAALALRKVKVSGSVAAGLKIAGLCRPLFTVYRERIEDEYPHLVI